MAVEDLDPNDPRIQRQVALAIKGAAEDLGNRVGTEEVLQELDVLKAISVEQDGFALGLLNLEESRVHVVIVSMSLGEEGWTATGIRPDYESIHRYDLPEQGSNWCGVLAFGVLGGSAAIGTVCDPTLNRVESVTSDGMLDSDIPRNGFALVLTERGTGAIQAFRGTQLAYAQTLGAAVATAPPPSFAKPGREGQRLAFDFTKTFLAEGLTSQVEASLYPGLEDSFRALQQIMTPSEWSVTRGPLQTGPGGVVIPIRGKYQNATFTISIRLRSPGEWQVVGAAFESE